MTLVISCLLLALVLGIDGACDVTINGVSYDREILVSPYYPIYLTFDDNTNELYYNYFWKGNIYVARMNLHSNTTYVMPLVKDSSDFAFNPQGKELYVGSANGIYKFVFKNDRLMREFYGPEKYIYAMQFSKVLYYSTSFYYKLYVVKNGIHSLVEDLKDTTVEHFLIDDERNIMYYSNRTGLYKQRVGSTTKDAELIFDLWGTTVLSVALDSAGRFAVCVRSYDSGLYLMNEKSKFKKIRDSCKNVALSKDGRIFLTEPEFQVLTPAKGAC